MQGAGCEVRRTTLLGRQVNEIRRTLAPCAARLCPDEFFGLVYGPQQPLQGQAGGPPPPIADPDPRGPPDLRGHLPHAVTKPEPGSGRPGTPQTTT